MFETVAPEAFGKPSRLLFYESLPASIALHAVAIGVAAILFWNEMRFPQQPPKVMSSYILAAGIPPPPPPPPPPAAAPRSQPAPVQTPTPVDPTQVLAPTEIPDTIPVVPTMAPKMNLAPLAPVAPGVPGGVEGGVEGGVAGGELGGVVGGTKGGIPGGQLGTDGRLHFARDASLPMTLEYQPVPEYPLRAASAGWQDTVVVHYTIGKDGIVRDVRIVKNAYRKIFDEPTLDALKRWRFKPLIYNGEPIEVEHELTVYFKLQ